MTSMRRNAAMIVCTAFALQTGCKKDNPETCRASRECPAPQVCDPTTFLCVDLTDAANPDVEFDGGVESVSGCGENSDCTDSGARICDKTTKSCVECLETSDCPSSGLRPVCNKTSRSCVECLDNAACFGPAPICDGNQCRACRSDSECVNGPKVCLDTGHCATETSTVYVEFNGSDCTGKDGTAAAPFCTPSEGAALLSISRPLMVVKGPVAGPLSLAPAGFVPTVVGRQTANGGASISAGPGIGVALTAGQAFVRDLEISGGTSTAGRGVVASGSGTKLSLLRVSVTGNKGTGVEATTGAELVMSRCMVTSNNAGGVHNAAANTTITNTVIASNPLYGAKFENAASSVFMFNTVVGNNLGVTCSGGAQKVVGCILENGNDACALENSTETVPAFSPSRPYHLTAHVSCGSFSSTVTDDIDGDSRTGAYDCGADQYVP